MCMTAKSISTAFVLIAVSSLVCHAAFAKPSDGFFYETRKITDHVDLIYRPDPVRVPAEGNITVIDQQDGLVVIDAGGSPVGGERVVQKIKKLSRKPVRFLIYTHYHGDHNLGAGAFLKAWPNVTIISTEKTRENMAGAPMDYIKTYDKAYEGYADVIKDRLSKPDTPETERVRWAQLREDLPLIVKAYHNLVAYPARMTFNDHISLYDPAAPVEVMFLGRANTDGDAVIWLPKQRVLASGDIVVHPIPYASASFPGEWIDVLRKLEGFDFAYLIPGHGEVQTDRQYLDKLIATLSDIRAQVTPLAQKGMSLADVRKQVNGRDILQSYAGDNGWDRLWMRSVFLNAIIGNAYKEAKGEAIVQGHDDG